IILAIMASRRVPVVLNHWLTPDKLGAMRQRLTMGAAIIGAELAPNLWPNGSMLRLDVSGAVQETAFTHAISQINTPASAALVLLTSGSRGEPKAVALS